MPAVEAGILIRGTTVAFRHPLIRSAVHSAASTKERQRVQAALAATSAPERRAWHRAEATDGPDDVVAAELEAASELAQARGGYSEQALVLTRAAEMTAHPGKRAERYLHAAAAHLTSGNLAEVQTLIDLATPDLTGPQARVHAARLRASVEMICSRPRKVPAMLLEAVADLRTTDPMASWDLLREAVQAAIIGGRMITGTTPHEVAKAAADAWRESELPAWSPDPLIAALARSIAYGYAEEPLPWPRPSPDCAPPTSFRSRTRSASWSASRGTNCGTSRPSESSSRSWWRQTAVAEPSMDSAWHCSRSPRWRSGTAGSPPPRAVTTSQTTTCPRPDTSGRETSTKSCSTPGPAGKPNSGPRRPRCAPCPRTRGPE
ncbi:hypothetical protein ACFQ51_55235 [Streptomyces kaempferi]